MSSKKTLVVGVGGMAGNAINNFICTHPQGATFLCVNTHSDALDHSLAPHNLLIGEIISRGKGAGGHANIGKAAAEESLREITPFITNADTICLIAGLGGGTGSGAIQVIAKHALELGKQVVCIVSTPFEFEGKERDIVAREALAGLDLIGVQKRVFNNQDLFKMANERTTFADAFKMADEVTWKWIDEVINGAPLADVAKATQ